MAYCKISISSLYTLRRHLTAAWSPPEDLVMNLWIFLSDAPWQLSNTRTATHTSPPAEAALSAWSNHAVQQRHVFPLCTHQDDVTYTESCAPRLQLNLKHLHILTQVSVIWVDSLKVCLASKETIQRESLYQIEAQSEKLPVDNG